MLLVIENTQTCLRHTGAGGRCRPRPAQRIYTTSFCSCFRIFSAKSMISRTLTPSI